MRTANTTKAPPPHTSSLTSGAMGLGPSSSSSSTPASVSSAAWGSRTSTETDTPCRVTTAVSTSAPSRSRTEVDQESETDEDEDHEADEGECLGEGDAEEHRGADHSGGLGLAGHRFDGLADDVADADAGSDGGKAIGEPGGAGRRGGLGLVTREVVAGLSCEASERFHVCGSPVLLGGVGDR